MRGRGLLVVWVAAVLAFLALLVYELGQWSALSRQALRADEERRRVAGEIRLREAQMQAEVRAQAALLREMQWTTGGSDPAGFLTRLAAQAGDRLRVTGVGPLERQATPQWNKSWHAVQVVGPYRELRALVGRIEAERGVLEDLRVEPAPAPARADAAPTDEVQARFRLVALELSPQARRVMERALSPAGAPAALPPAGDPPLARDPFAFVTPPPAPPPPPPAAARPEVPLVVSAIMGTAGGYLAIVNNQVVRVGDVVSGHRIVAITETTVSVREPDAPARTLSLPELTAPPAPPRR